MVQHMLRKRYFSQQRDPFSFSSPLLSPPLLSSPVSSSPLLSPPLSSSPPLLSSPLLFSPLPSPFLPSSPLLWASLPSSTLLLSLSLSLFLLLLFYLLLLLPLLCSLSLSRSLFHSLYSLSLFSLSLVNFSICLSSPFLIPSLPLSLFIFSFLSLCHYFQSDVFIYFCVLGVMWSLKFCASTGQDSEWCFFNL